MVFYLLLFPPPLTPIPIPLQLPFYVFSSYYSDLARADPTHSASSMPLLPLGNICERLSLFSCCKGLSQQGLYPQHLSIFSFETSP